MRLRQQNGQDSDSESASPNADVKTTVRETTVVRETSTDDGNKIVEESRTVETSSEPHSSDSQSASSGISDGNADMNSDPERSESPTEDGAEQQPSGRIERDASSGGADGAQPPADTTANGDSSSRDGDGPDSTTSRVEASNSASESASQASSSADASQHGIGAQVAEAESSTKSERKHALSPRVQQILDDVKARLDIASPFDEELHRKLDDAISMGSDQAMAYKGTALLHGDGIKPDVQQATKLFKQAAEMGNAHAQRELAFLYSNGFIGTEPDEVTQC
jgi:hypothetical protein